MLYKNINVEYSEFNIIHYINRIVYISLHKLNDYTKITI